MAKRVPLSFTDKEMIELHKWNETGLPLATAVKWLVLDALRIMSGKLVTTPIGSNTIYPGSGKFPRGSVTTPRPPKPTPNGTRELFTPEKKEEEDTKKEDVGLSAVTGAIVARVSELRPGNGVFTVPPYKKYVKSILKMGFTQANMLTVIEWKAAECERKKDWQYFKPATLLRQGSFAEKLDESNAGVEVRGFDTNPNNQSDQQDYSKGVDENGNW